MVEAPPRPEDLALVGVYREYREAADHGLVILSMRLAYWMFGREGSYHLCVERPHVEAVREQLAKFDRENRMWPPQPEDFPQYPVSGWVLTWMGVFLAVLFLGPLAFPGLVSREALVTQGVLDVQRVIGGGEWWRTITALTLHADIAHLLANLVGGGFLGYLAMRTTGAGLGVLLIVLAGMLGNLFTAAIYFPQEHLSLGASTMVFGALGILVGTARFSLRRARSGMKRWVPVGAGITLLGILGTGDARTDVLAHLGGFLAGWPLGLLGAFLLRKGPLKVDTDRALVLAAGIVLGTGWWHALTAGG